MASYKYEVVGADGKPDAAYSSGGESLFLLGQPMKMAAVMLAIIPIMCAYPFFQKYFTAGMTAGAVKG